VKHFYKNNITALLCCAKAKAKTYGQTGEMQGAVAKVGCVLVCVRRRYKGILHYTPIFTMLFLWH